MPPKGKRRSNALVTRDAFELLRLVDGEGMLIDDAMVELKLSRSRAYDLLGRARSAVLRSQNEANKKAAEVNTKRWYEAAPEPMSGGDDIAATEVKDVFTGHPLPADQPSGDDGPPFDNKVSAKGIESIPTPTPAPATAMELPSAGHSASTEPEFLTLPDGTKRRIRPQQPTEDIYEWSHVMEYSSFRVKTPWRQAQLIAQWKENEAQGGKPFTPVLRGGIKNRNCFRGCPSYQCTCEDNL
jgi:predicted DNA-binding protein (UPF0251 family)